MPARSDDFAARTVLVTGGSLGIGLEVSRKLARLGARVLIAARGRGPADAALAQLDGGPHQYLQLDVSDQGSWDAAMRKVDDFGSLHGLVTAAGVLGPIGPLKEVSPQELLDTIRINLLGTMFALHHALPRLQSTGGRAVTFSGGGATSPLPRYDAYAASKAAVVRLTENVAAAGVVAVNCVAPGFVATRMHEETIRAGPAAAGADYYERTVQSLADGGVPASEAASLVCFLLSPDSDGITGRLLSAQWDPWREERFRDRLKSDPDLATLRRIDEQLFERVGR